MTTSLNPELYYHPKDRVTTKLVLQAELTNHSPLLISNGMSDAADLELLCLPNGQPYLPGSSLAGVLRTFFDEDLPGYRPFWGYSNPNDPRDEAYQSHIIIEDAFLLDQDFSSRAITRKDGVKINAATNLAEDGAKYDYQVLEPGHRFSFRAEVTIRNDYLKTEIIQLTDLMQSVLAKGLRLGAFTQSGFGKLVATNNTLLQFDFQNDADNWFKHLGGDQDAGSLVNLTTAQQLSLVKTKDFHLIADFHIRKGLITSTYGAEMNQPDKTQATRYNKGKGEQKEFIISGKSIRGAIRKRCKKILYTVWDDRQEAQDFLDDLFGFVREKPKPGEAVAKRSRVRVEESVIKNVSTQAQTRIKIDRFTGGTIDAALMETEPIHAQQKDQRNLTIELKVRQVKPDEICLLLMVLKDLWTGDLAIGGEKSIGRGTLSGLQANLTLGEYNLQLQQSGDQILITDPGNMLQKYNSFQTEKNNNHETAH